MCAVIWLICTDLFPNPPVCGITSLCVGYPPIYMRSRGGKKVFTLFYLSKSVNSAMRRYSVTSKRPELKTHLSKRTKEYHWYQNVLQIPKVKVLLRQTVL